MGLMNKKGIPLVAPFILHAKELLDARQKVDTIAERDALVTDNAVAEGLRVFVKETKQCYYYDGNGWVNMNHPAGDGNFHVPATGSNNENKVLTAGKNPGEMSWKSLSEMLVNTMKGATDIQDGESGTVPAPKAGDSRHYLRGDGTWASLDALIYDIPVMTPSTTENNGIPGLVPGPIKGDNGNSILKSDGTWVSVNTLISNIQTMIPATESNNGIPGLVPGPSKGDKGDSILMSNGTWVNIDIFSSKLDHPKLIGATPTSDGESGIVPQPMQGDQLSFLRGDGTWAVPLDTRYNVFTPATNIQPGTIGLVPAPPIRDDGTNVLRSDGTWSSVVDIVQSLNFVDMVGSTITTDGKAGLVPAPKAGEHNKLLRGDGTWVSPAEVSVDSMTGATDSTNGVAGLVPTPMAGEEDYFLKGDGTWAPIVGGTGDIRIFAGATSNAKGVAGLVPAPEKTDINNFLKGDGTWANLHEILNTLPIFAPPADDNSNGTAGLVPPPLQFDGGYNILKSDGTWSTIDDMERIVGLVSKDRPGLVPAPSKDDNGMNIYMSDGTYRSLSYLNMVGATSTTDGKSGTVPTPLRNQELYYLRGDGTWQDPSTLTSLLNIMKGSSLDSNGTAGLVPAPSNDEYDKFLRGDGTWAIPHDTTYTTFRDNYDGLVPKPVTIQYNHYLKSDGTWGEPHDTTYNTFTNEYDGLVPKPDEVLSNHYLKSDGTWGEPHDTTYNTFTNTTDGLVRHPTCNESDNTNNYLRVDGTWGEPHDTTYNVFDTTNDGLVPAPSDSDNNSLLCGDGTWSTDFNGYYYFRNGIANHATLSVGTGYLKIARITITKQLQDSPMIFEIIKRNGGTIPCIISLQFVNSASTDPAISSFTYHGSNFKPYIVKASSGIWDLYVEKINYYDQTTVTQFSTNYNGSSPVVTWEDVTIPTLPSGGTYATFYLPASSAITDANGLNINSTYIKGISQSGTSLVYTRGNNSSSSFSINAETSVRDHWNQTIVSTYIKNISQSGTTITTTKGDGTTSTFDITALKDSNDQVIINTYIKGISFSGNTLTLTKGDGTTLSFSIGGVVVSGSAPAGNSNQLWIDTSSGGAARYWTGGSWAFVKGVWGS